MTVTLRRQRSRKRSLPCPVQPTLPTVDGAAGLKHLPQPAPPVPRAALAGGQSCRSGIPLRLSTYLGDQVNRVINC